MSDSEIPAAPPQEPDSAPEPAPEMEAEPQEKHSQEPTKKPSNNNSSLTFSIWPPTQRTRDAVVNRLVETLSTVSVLSKRYGTLPQDEASVAARLIEEEAFAAAAGGSFSAEDDGIEILQVYSREISRRMLDTVKNRASSGSAADTTTPLTASPSVAPATTTTTASEDDSSAVTES